MNGGLQLRNNEQVQHNRLDKFQEDAIIAHNKFRGKHHAAPLKWSAGLAEGARQWATALLEKGNLKHSNQPFVGENIWIGKNQKISGTRVTHSWYNEIDSYDFDAPGFNTKTRNFTQIVWRETTSIGVAKVCSPEGVSVVVARYYPAANVLGKFEENVLKPTDAPRNIVPVLAQPPETAKEDLQKELLMAHNRYRKKHGVPLLQWSSELTEGAKLWAEEVGRRREVRSFGSPEYGENIIVVDGQNIPGGVATDLWYDEIKNYSFMEPELNNKTGHFTQVVWASTRFVGAAKITTSDGRCIVIARYFPPGNIHEDLKKNVKPIRSQSQTDLPGHNQDVFTHGPIPKDIKDQLTTRDSNEQENLKSRKKHDRKTTCSLQ